MTASMASELTLNNKIRVTLCAIDLKNDIPGVCHAKTGSGRQSTIAGFGFERVEGSKTYIDKVIKQERFLDISLTVGVSVSSCAF